MSLGFAKAKEEHSKWRHLSSPRRRTLHQVEGCWARIKMLPFLAQSLAYFPNDINTILVIAFRETWRGLGGLNIFHFRVFL